MIWSLWNLSSVIGRQSDDRPVDNEIGIQRWCDRGRGVAGLSAAWGPSCASLNIAMAIADLEDPVMADFINALDAVNGIADRSPGFVWRLKDDSGREMPPGITPYA